MITPAQLDSLDDLIGKEGVHYLAIMENDNADLGTKVLYLERAITQNLKDFLASLDKLYRPHARGESRKKNIELIRSLKFINDICFNHELKFGVHGTKKALVHYFRPLGSGIDANAFHQQIRLMIHARIGESVRDVNEKAKQERERRLAYEKRIVADAAWRVTLDLPMDQQAAVSGAGAAIREYFAILTRPVGVSISWTNERAFDELEALSHGELASLSYQKLSIFSSYPVEAVRLMKDGYFTWQQLKALSDNALYISLALLTPGKLSLGGHIVRVGFKTIAIQMTATCILVATLGTGFVAAAVGIFVLSLFFAAALHMAFHDSVYSCFFRFFNRSVPSPDLAPTPESTATGPVLGSPERLFSSTRNHVERPETEAKPVYTAPISRLFDHKAGAHPSPANTMSGNISSTRSC